MPHLRKRCQRCLDAERSDGNDDAPARRVAHRRLREAGDQSEAVQGHDRDEDQEEVRDKLRTPPLAAPWFVFRSTSETTKTTGSSKATRKSFTIVATSPVSGETL